MKKIFTRLSIISYLSMVPVLLAQTYTLEPISVTDTTLSYFEDTQEELHSQVQIQETAPGLYNPVINGLQGDKISITVDGLRFSNAIWRSGPNQYFSWIPQEFVLNNDVLPTSDAIGSTLNTDLGINGNILSYKFDQYNTGNKVLGTIDCDSVKAGVKYYTTDNYNDVNHTSYNQNAFYLEQDSTIGTSRILFSESKDIDRPDKFLKNKPYTWDKQQYLLLQHTYAFNKENSIVGSFQRFFEEVNDNGTIYSTRDHMYGLKYQSLITNEINVYISNYYEDIQHKDDNYLYNTVSAGVEYTQNYNLFSFYARYNVSDAYVKWDNEKKNFFNNAITLEIFDDSWYGRYDYGYKFPTLENLAYAQTTGKGYDLPNNNLKQETSHTFTLGIKDNKGEKLTYDASIFYLYMNNLIDREKLSYQINDEDVYQSVNIDTGYMFGANLSTNFSIAQFDNIFTLQYVYGKTEQDYISKLTPLKLFYKTVYDDFYFKWEYAPKSHTLSQSDQADVRIVDDRYNQYNNKGYNIFSVGLKKEITKKQVISVDLNNIFDNDGRVIGSSVDVPERSFSISYIVKL
ncbi:hypothetical protein [Sulfurimonas sp.]|uniref:hypothetical protein n=1 Tax=Sulfurimonas sp. TaxID=2022749 RepID=UPI003D124C72